MFSIKLNSQVSRLALAAALVVPAGVLSATQAEAQIGIGIGISVHIAPPALPVYVQPPLPAPGYLWTPGYWAYGDAGYYWVPGVWVQPPTPGFLWTPAYWGYAGGVYGFHAGYWGPHVGFYGGINYGFGYGGVGFFGGEWRGGVFAYNSAVANFGGVHVTNVYNNVTIVHQNTIINANHVAFNGGPGGINRAPSPQENQWSHEQHVQPTANQMQHQQVAMHTPGQQFNNNHGNPTVRAAATNQAFAAHPTNAALASHPDQREANQDQRVANGLKSGQMTSGEAARADKTQAGIDQEVKNDRAANGGTLTSQQHQQVNQQQNAASRQIYNENHNANTVAPNQVNNREANQQQRTANGLRSGQMTSGEAARTNSNQAAADKTVHNERTANGGALTGQQKQQANQQENHDSHQITRENHNDDKR